MAVGSSVRVSMAALALVAMAQPSRAAIFRNHRRGEINAANDVHDGTISQWEPGGDYFWYGMQYTSCRMNDGWLRPVYQAINLFVSTLAPMAATCNGFNCAPIAFKRFGIDCGFLTAPQGQTVKVWRSCAAGNPRTFFPHLVITPAPTRPHCVPDAERSLGAKMLHAAT